MALLDPLALSRPPLMRVPVRWAARHLGVLVNIARARRRVIVLCCASGVVALVPCRKPGLRPLKRKPPRGPLPLQ
jgi:hypothetical protein